MEVVKEIKYLGVQVDNSLDWKEHTKIVSSKASRALGILKHAKIFLAVASLETLYFRTVESHFGYCSSFTKVAVAEAPE